MPRTLIRRLALAALAAILSAASSPLCAADELPVVQVEGQPLGANVARLIDALEMLGRRLPADAVGALRQAAAGGDTARLQQLLDPQVVLAVTVDAESRVSVARGPATARLQQAGYTPLVVKVLNPASVARRLRIASPQAGPPYAGAAMLSLERQQQTELNRGTKGQASADRFLAVELFAAPPMLERLSGLAVEYGLALVYASESGPRQATIGFDLEAGNRGPGFRGETPLALDIRPAVPVKLKVRDDDGLPSTARLEFRDRAGHVYPPQARRLAPDFFFQPQIYRADGGLVRLPPGQFKLRASRGPEYRVLERDVEISPGEGATLDVKLERWVNPRAFGFYSGDHHIHGAGCSHYTSPSEGVRPEDMFQQVKGEGLNVGCLLTWGPCFEFQRQFFSPAPHALSEPHTVVKYDLEISGFGSQALGHVCLLNLRDQTYPGSQGTKTKGWPTWTTPVLRWAKAQGAVVGYAHSASGLEIDPPAAARRLLAELDADGDQLLAREETLDGLLPERFVELDADADMQISLAELVAAHERAAGVLPNLAVPEMNGVGAMEICVAAAEGVCDFISAMDTPRVQEWTCWYHLLNCGLPIAVAGETDFPCMSSTRVGQGRSYVQLGQVERLDFAAWCRGLAAGRSYVSDGFAHALQFSVDAKTPGTGPVELSGPGNVRVRAKVAFAAETPRAVAHGTLDVPQGRRLVGDTVNLHAPRSDRSVRGGQRRVELVVNGRVLAEQEVPADGQPHDLEWSVPVQGSSWVALRQFPQLHTNPVPVLVAGRPIRASRTSAGWCVKVIEQLWRNREQSIAAAERDEARAAFERAKARFRALAGEAAPGT